MLRLLVVAYLVHLRLDNHDHSPSTAGFTNAVPFLRSPHRQLYKQRGWLVNLIRSSGVFGKAPRVAGKPKLQR